MGQAQRKLKRVLIIEDDAASLFLNKAVLEEAGVAERIDTVPNGLEALEYLMTICKRAAHGEDCGCPELLLVDINMPIVNGFEFLTLCRNMRLLEGRRMKILLVTSSEQEVDRQQGQAFEVDGYLVKPLNEEKLFAVLERFQQ